MTIYEYVTGEIIKAAKKYMEVVPEDEKNWALSEEHSFNRISNAMGCLRLAEKVWEECNRRDLWGGRMEQMRAAQEMVGKRFPASEEYRPG